MNITIMTKVNMKIENGSSLYKNSIYIHSKINKLYCYNLFLIKQFLDCLVRVSKTAHARHDAEHVVVGSINTDLCSRRASNRGVRQNELKGGVINTREVACARRLVLLRPESERVHVNAGVRGARVRLERLDKVEVAAFTLREAILTVELELGGDHRVVAPAVEGQRGLGEHEGAGIRDGGLEVGTTRGSTKIGRQVSRVRGGTALIAAEVNAPRRGRRNIASAGSLEQTIGGDEREVVAARGAVVRKVGNRLGAAEGMDRVREGINSVGVVERLGAKHTAEALSVDERAAVVNVGVRLDNPDQLLDRVIEVELDLVRRGTNRLITCELELLNQVLVGVLGHAPALVGVEEHVVHEQRGSNQRLVVGRVDLDTGRVKGADRPEALINRAKIDVDADLVVLEGNQREGKTRVLAEPELEGDVEGGFGEGVTRRAHLLGGIRLARAVNVGESRVSNVGELGRVANHRVVALLLTGGHGELVPDVHPVAVVAIDALAANLNLHLRDELLTGVIEPASEHIAGRVAEILPDLGQGDLKHRAVGKIAVARDGAGYAAAEVGLTVERLLNRLHREVGVSAVSDLPVSNLRVPSKIDVLGAVSYKLH